MSSNPMSQNLQFKKRILELTQHL
uniref:Uncharacterized protein n=1 Tax=Arundo donax TaxID=35708 RepID=A0A0A9HPM1_ARUDO